MPILLLGLNPLCIEHGSAICPYGGYTPVLAGRGGILRYRVSQ